MLQKYFKISKLPNISWYYLSQHLSFSEEISQSGLLHHLGDADASGNGDEDGNEGKTDFAPVPVKEGMIELGCHRKDGVEEVDGQRVATHI